MENPIKMDDLGVPGTIIFGNTHMLHGTGIIYRSMNGLNLWSMLEDRGRSPLKHSLLWIFVIPGRRMGESTSSINGC